MTTLKRLPGRTDKQGDLSAAEVGVQIKDAYPYSSIILTVWSDGRWDVAYGPHGVRPRIAEGKVPVWEKGRDRRRPPHPSSRGSRRVTSETVRRRRAAGTQPRRADGRFK